MNQVIPVKEFKKISKRFRVVYGQMLANSDPYEAIRLAKRFLMFIDEEPIIKDFIVKKHSQVYDFEKIIGEYQEEKFQLPIREDEELDYIYQLLQYVIKNCNSYLEFTFPYALYKGATYGDKVISFNKEVVKLFVDQITSFLEEMAIDMGIDERPNAKVILNGPVGSMTYTEGDIHGGVNINQVNNTEGQQLQELAKELIQLLKETDLQDSDLKEDALDYVTEVAEKAENGEEIKPSLIRRATNALTGVTGLVGSGTALVTTANQFLDTIQALPTP
ncbi:hypothetical protein ABEP50_29445 [Priestia megaterium]